MTPGSSLQEINRDVIPSSGVAEFSLQISGVELRASAVECHRHRMLQTRGAQNDRYVSREWRRTQRDIHVRLWSIAQR